MKLATLEYPPPRNPVQQIKSRNHFQMAEIKRQIETPEEPEPKRPWPPFPDPTRTWNKDRPVQIVLPQVRNPDPRGLSPPIFGRSQPPLWRMHPNGLEGMREWTDYAKEHLITMSIKTWSRYRLSAMFCRLVSPIRQRPPLVQEVPNLPQDYFTFDFDDARNISDFELESDTD